MKSCPFCGVGIPDFGTSPTRKKKKRTTVAIVWIFCRTCGARTKVFGCLCGDEESIAKAFNAAELAWNTRPGG